MHLFVTFAVVLSCLHLCACVEEPQKEVITNKTLRREHSIAEIPYIVYLEMHSLNHPSYKDYHGAGTIIDVNIVLTVAYHCEYAKSKTMRVYPGQTYVEPRGKPFLVKDYLMHPKRNRKTADQAGKQDEKPMDLRFNQCLLRLDRSLEFGRYIQKAPLPMPDDEPIRMRDFLSSGWGPYENKEFVQGHITKGKDYTKTGLFYQMTWRGWDAPCLQRILKFKAIPPKNPFCLKWPVSNHRTAYGDDGGPIVDTETGLVVAIVANFASESRYKYYSPTAKLNEAVDWINQVRKRWLRLAPNL